MNYRVKETLEENQHFLEGCGSVEKCGLRGAPQNDPQDDLQDGANIVLGRYLT